ncbi:MAG: hypothetical protein V4726_00485 [Verrucomicrobiota bacterium]
MLRFEESKLQYQTPEGTMVESMLRLRIPMLRFEISPRGLEACTLKKNALVPLDNGSGTNLGLRWEAQRHTALDFSVEGDSVSQQLDFGRYPKRCRRCALSPHSMTLGVHG